MPGGDVSPSKLRIESYKDTDYKHRTGVFYARINPDAYSHGHSISYTKSETDAQGSPGAPSPFIAISPEKVSFELIFDGTGIIPGCTDIVSDIALLKKVAYYYDGNIHRPSYLLLKWGDNFKRMDDTNAYFTCQLTSLDISYTLFKPNGTPLRAKASVSFEEFRTSAQIRAAANTNSPDLTHTKLVKKGDTLPMLCYDVYKDESYYLEVAKVNNLTSFRNLRPGQELIFPPLKR